MCDPFATVAKLVAKWFLFSDSSQVTKSTVEKIPKIHGLGILVPRNCKWELNPDLPFILFYFSFFLLRGTPCFLSVSPSLPSC